MCTPPTTLDAIVKAAVRHTDVLLFDAATAAPVNVKEQAIAVGSRRKRIWELGVHAHCPVVGVCLPLPALHRLIGKVLGDVVMTDDYELHCSVVTECKFRNQLSQAIQKALDSQHVIALQQSNKIKTTQALEAWWLTESSKNLAAAFWCVLTHPRCSPDLGWKVLGHVHMVQHQVGAAMRLDQQQLDALMHENAVLTRSLGQAQQRNTQQSQQYSQKMDTLEKQLMHLRAELIGRDTTIMALTDERQKLDAVVPQLKSRLELVRQLETQIGKTHQLERSLLQAEQDMVRLQARLQTLSEQLAASSKMSGTDGDAPAEENPYSPIRQLDDCTILCVGGRPSAVPTYRQLIEKMGGRFLHHDGGAEDNVARLDHILAAADLVICQTGCIGHDAYWRVKNHCKRTGKDCVYLDNPSAHSLAKGLSQVVSVVRRLPA